MFWLTWRQFRPQAIVAAVALAAMAVTLAVTGPHLAALYHDSGLGDLHGRLRQARSPASSTRYAAQPARTIFYGGSLPALCACPP